MPDIAPDSKDHTEQIQAWRDAGWLVRVTFEPDRVECKLVWLGWTAEAPSPRPPRGIGPTVAAAVERCAEAMERNRR